MKQTLTKAQRDAMVANARRIIEARERGKNSVEKGKSAKKSTPRYSEDSPSAGIAKVVEKNLEKAEKQKQSKSKPQEYKAFVVWLSLPAALLGKTDDEYEKLGIDEPMYLRLLKIKNRAQFSREFGVSADTLTDWSKELSFLEGDQEMKKFFNTFTKALIFAFAREQLKRPTSQGLETWFEIIKDRSKNLNINLSGSVKSDLPDEEKNAIREIIRSFRKRK